MISGAISAICGIFRRAYPEMGYFREKSKIPKFPCFVLWMALMTCPGKNIHMQKISGPLTCKFSTKKCIFGICFDFPGGVNLTGRDVVKFGFWAKINFFA